jgi:hypothetical protein
MATNRYSVVIERNNMKEIQVVWDNMEMADPVFTANSVHSAAASIPVSPSGLACTAELYLSTNGTTKNATSGPVSFISGASQVSFQITMPNPASGQSYGVYLVILSGGIQLAGFHASEDVVIPSVGMPTITWS